MRRAQLVVAVVLLANLTSGAADAGPGGRFTDSPALRVPAPGRAGTARLANGFRRSHSVARALVGTATPRWLGARIGDARTRLARNRTEAGAIIAAPSDHPDYRYHWTRDAALVTAEDLAEMEELETDRAGAGAARMRALVAGYARYVAFSGRIVAAGGRTGRGEAKYEIDARPYLGPWGNPQHDGPALRAIGNIRFARLRLRAGDAGYVERELFGGPGTLIRGDLDHVVGMWKEPSFDLWEEELADHFYTRMVQHQALVQGAALASELGDDGAAERYSDAAADLARAIAEHWEPQYGLLRASRNHRGGVDYKWRGLDMAVVLAVLHTDGPLALISPLDERVLSTAAKLEADFRATYPMNRGRGRAVAMGRYPEDRYTGYDNADDGGNPWVLTTHAMAELHYRVADELGDVDTLQITRFNRPFYVAALGRELRIGSVLAQGDAALDELRRELIGKGDELLALAWSSRDAAGVQHEQMHRADGRPTGARDLTWNHASLLSAERARRDATQ